MAFTQQQTRRKLFHLYTIKKSKRTPTPEEMFRPLIKKGLAFIQRRPYKVPRLVFTQKFRRGGYSL